MKATIEIVRSLNADSRSATNMTLTSLLDDTLNHIRDVSEALEFIATLIVDRGELHDHTKLDNFQEFFDALQSGDVKHTEWYQRHITQERHHLKSNAPGDVTIIDVIEHLVDCTMAGLARSGDIYDVDISPFILQQACQNTVKLLKDNTHVVTVGPDILNTNIEDASGD